jgi:hypothetical protein
MDDNHNDDIVSFFEDIERVRDELGKGMTIEEIAEKLGMEKDYAEFILEFGIIG